MAVDCDYDCNMDEIMVVGRTIVARSAHHCNPQEDSRHKSKSAKELMVAATQRLLQMPNPKSKRKPDRDNTPRHRLGSFEAGDPPPLSALEQAKMKLEANKVVMYSFSGDDCCHRNTDNDRKVVVTVISGSGSGNKSTDTLSTATASPSTSRDEDFQENIKHPFADTDTDMDIDMDLDLGTNSIYEEDAKSPTDLLGISPSNSCSEYTSFGKTPSGYLYPIASSSSKQDGDGDGDEGQEHTVENFNRFLEISSMTTNSYDHALAMASLGNGKTPFKGKGEGGSILQSQSQSQSQSPPSRQRGIWPERLLRGPEMSDAPSGILLVFDRMLDCIDPGGSSRPSVVHQHNENDTDNLSGDEEYVCGYETDTDQSSAWSLSVNRSWLLEEFGDLALSTTGSATTDDCSLGLLLSDLDPVGLEAPPPPLLDFQAPGEFEWLDESIDCIFPCWKESTGEEDAALQNCKTNSNTHSEIDPKQKQPPSIRELAEAVEAGRKRKWACEENTLSTSELDLALEDEDKNEDEDGSDAKVEVLRNAGSKDRDSEARAAVAVAVAAPIELVHPDGFCEDPFDFPPPEFPVPVWKKPEPIDIDIEAEVEHNSVTENANDTEIHTDIGIGIGIDTDTDIDIDKLNVNASGSSLSELFEGLIFGMPSDEKDEGDDEELRRFLDRTSLTEETSTLGYSDGSI